MTTAILHRPAAFPRRFSVTRAVVVGSAVAGVIAVALLLLAAGLGSASVRRAVPAPAASEPGVAVDSLSPMVWAGAPADSVVGGTSPISPVAPAVDHVGPFSETPDSWPAHPPSGSTTPASPVAPALVAPAPIDREAATVADDEVGLIPPAIAWRDADGEVHQGLIGVDDIPAEVLALPEGVTLDE